MTLTTRLRSLFSVKPSPVTPAATGLPPSPTVEPSLPILPDWFDNEFPTTALSNPIPTEPMPAWLADEENLRDEGVLFGLSDGRPDEKIAQIRAHFSQQAVPIDEVINQHTERIGELNLCIEQRESRITTRQNQVDELLNSQPVASNLLRNGVSLILSVLVGVGTFYLVEETLRPAFPNRWIAVGVFGAGMFNLFGRVSFFYETDTRLTSRRLVEELGLPLAASVFVFVQALQTQSIGQAAGLGFFLFFLFLLAGKLLLSTLTALQTDLNSLGQNRQLARSKAQNGPRWEAEIEQLVREIDAIRAQKWPLATALNRAEAQRTLVNTQRDKLVNVFISEFELARSLRERKAMMNYDRVAGAM